MSMISSKLLINNIPLCNYGPVFLKGFLSGLNQVVTWLSNPYDARTKDGRTWKSGAKEGNKWLDKHGHIKAAELYKNLREEKKT